MKSIDKPKRLGAVLKLYSEKRRVVGLFKIYFKNFQILPSRIKRENRIAWREILLLLLIFIVICIQDIYNYKGCPNKSARFNFLIKRIIYSKSVDIFISV